MIRLSQLTWEESSLIFRIPEASKACVPCSYLGASLTHSQVYKPAEPFLRTPKAGQSLGQSSHPYRPPHPTHTENKQYN